MGYTSDARVSAAWVRIAKVTGFSAAIVAATLPSSSQAGPACVEAGDAVVNNHALYSQSDPVVLSTVNMGGDVYCGPTSSAYVLGGFADWPRINPDGPAARANGPGSNLNTFTGVVKDLSEALGVNILFQVGSSMEVNASNIGAWQWWKYGPVLNNGLSSSIYNYGNTPVSTYGYYQADPLPANVTTDTFAEPICASYNQASSFRRQLAASPVGKVFTSSPYYGGSGSPAYDYSKTQFQVVYGYYSTDEIEVPYPCGDWYYGYMNQWCEQGSGLYKIWRDSGHVVAAVGGGNNWGNEHVWIDNPWGERYPVTLGSITIQILGMFTVFDNAGLMWEPTRAATPYYPHLSAYPNHHKVVEDYVRVWAQHGGICPSGQGLTAAGYCQ